MFYVQFVLVVLIDTEAENQSDGLLPVKPFLNPPVIITDRPKAVRSLRFHLFCVQCCPIFRCF